MVKAGVWLKYIKQCTLGLQYVTVKEENVVFHWRSSKLAMWNITRSEGELPVSQFKRLHAVICNLLD